MGKFIIFEGIDGCGKSTQINKLYEYLIRKGLNVYKTFEPTNSEIGVLLRRFLKGELKTDNKVLAGLFASDRLHHLLNTDNGLVSKYNNDFIILCDRNFLSNFAYQHDSEYTSLKFNEHARKILKPDAHIFIDVAPKICLNRIKTNRENIDIFENLDELMRIYNNYFTYFDLLKDEENIIIINGNQDENLVFNEILNKISNLISF